MSTFKFQCLGSGLVNIPGPALQLRSNSQFKVMCRSILKAGWVKVLDPALSFYAALASLPYPSLGFSHEIKQLDLISVSSDHLRTLKPDFYSIKRVQWNEERCSLGSHGSP